MRVLAFSLIAAMGAGSAAFAADKPVVKPFTAPPPGPQYFFWLEGGYTHLDTHRLHAFDIGLPFAPVHFRLDDGWYGRGEAGVTLAQRLWWIDVISVAAGYRAGSGDTDAAGRLGLAFQDPTVTSTFQRDPGVGTAHQDFSLLDIQLRLKHVPATHPGSTIALEPFFARLDHDSSSTVDDVGGGDTATVNARVDGRIFGVQAAIEGNQRVGPATTLRGRASLGGYYVDSDARFDELFFGNSSRSSREFGGVRAGVEVGVDYALSPNITFGLTAGIDHWTSLPYARLTERNGGTAGPFVGINTASFTDYFVGVRLTLATGGR